MAPGFILPELPLLPWVPSTQPGQEGAMPAVLMLPEAACGNIVWHWPCLITCKGLRTGEVGRGKGSCGLSGPGQVSAVLCSPFLLHHHPTNPQLQLAWAGATLFLHIILGHMGAAGTVLAQPSCVLEMWGWTGAMPGSGRS